MDPSRAVAYLNLGDAQGTVDDKDNARKAYQTYFELAPSGAEAVHARRQVEKI